jgi:hypothetical protein
LFDGLDESWTIKTSLARVETMEQSILPQRAFELCGGVVQLYRIDHGRRKALDFCEDYASSHEVPDIQAEATVRLTRAFDDGLGRLERPHVVGKIQAIVAPTFASSHRSEGVAHPMCRNARSISPAHLIPCAERMRRPQALPGWSDASRFAPD